MVSFVVTLTVYLKGIVYFGESEYIIQRIRFHVNTIMDKNSNAPSCLAVHRHFIEDHPNNPLQFFKFAVFEEVFGGPEERRRGKMSFTLTENLDLIKREHERVKQDNRKHYHNRRLPNLEVNRSFKWEYNLKNHDQDKLMSTFSSRSIGY